MKDRQDGQRSRYHSRYWERPRRIRGCLAPRQLAASRCQSCCPWTATDSAAASAAATNSAAASAAATECASHAAEYKRRFSRGDVDAKERCFSSQQPEGPETPATSLQGVLWRRVAYWDPPSC